MRALIIILFVSITLAAFGQDYPDSGFTNKAEAKNLMVNGLKEGKWIDYYKDTIVGIGEGRHSKEVPTTDTSKANEYHLTVYKKAQSIGTLRTYYKNGILKDETPQTYNKIDGVEKRYYETGKIEAKVIWKNCRVIKVINYDDNGNETKK
jgi:antitoxin component YwqK of YwqJK toxin-antitoxin module